MHNIKELKVWRKSIELSTDIYKALINFPADEKYCLTSQIKRSAISIPSNIAEGAGRNSNKEFIYFLGIANGSCFELLTQIVIAMKLELISIEESKDLSYKIVEIQKMIYGFRQKLVKEIKK